MTEQATNNNNLQSGNIDDNIPNVDESQTAQPSEGGSTPEDTDVIRNLIAQKDAQIALLQDELKKSHQSWEQAIRQGAAIGNVQTGEIGITPNQSQEGDEPYVRLRDMDFSLSKKDLNHRK